MGTATGKSPATEEELAHYKAQDEARANEPPAEPADEPVDEPVEEEGDHSSLTVAQLKEYAEEHGIDLGGATKKDDILAAIEAHGDDEDEEGEE
jgi:hypothetical protein